MYNWQLLYHNNNSLTKVVKVRFCAFRSLLVSKLLRSAQVRVSLSLFPFHAMTVYVAHWKDWW